MAPSGPFGQTIHKEEKEIIIEKDCGSHEIAEILVNEGIISHPYGFLIKGYIDGKLKSLKAGEYLIPVGCSVEDVIQKIANGDVIHRAITIPEGLTVKEIIKKLKEISILSEEIVDEFPEGSLFPATYPYHRGESRNAILKRMKTTMDQVLDELWQEYGDNAHYSSKEEALIMASLIEKESSIKRTEQPHIAAVFINRLKSNMPLQCDPTVIYAITEGETALGRELSLKDLKCQSPYNTYLQKGLPPSPIACPGKSAIKAALVPAKSQDLFFVADGTGGHRFAQTLKDHNQNVAYWRQIQREMKNNSLQ
jgi:UPF0755 protein